MRSPTQRKNLVIVTALAGAALLAFNRWVLPELVELRPISDGERAYASDDSRLRYAAWEEPLPPAGEIDTPGRESHAALSPDGRWIVYCVGQVGSAGEGAGEAELWIAEVERGAAHRPRPLAELNGPTDDLAPAFGENALYFASDRGGSAGGFDLYASAWDGSSFAAPEPVGGGVNTEADELDPAPLGRALVFASNRPREGRTGYDLYSAGDLDESGRRTVVPLDVVSSSADERDPALSSDGRALYFASNRDKAPEDFDLYRSFRERGAWLPAAVLRELATTASERSPQPSPDGFALRFDRVGDPQRELLYARSIELFRGGEPLRGWADLLLMAALVLLALVAALSKQFNELDLLYKCLLISVLVHLMWLLWMRYVHPEAEAWKTEREERSPAFRVRLEPAQERQRGLVERGGELESEPERVELTQPAPERLELAQVERLEVLPEPAAALERAPSKPAEAPERGELELARGETSADAPAIAAPSEAVERRSSEPAQLALATPVSTDPERSSSAASGPVAARIAREVDVVDAPSRQDFTRRIAGSDAELPAASFTPAVIAPSAIVLDREPGPSVALPNETRTRIQAGDAVAPAPDARAFDAARSGGGESTSAPARAEVARNLESTGNESVALPEARAFERRGARVEAPPTRYEPGTSAPPGNVASEHAGPAVAMPAERVERANAGTAGSPESESSAPAPAAIEARRTEGLAGGPSERFRAPSSALESSAPAAADAPRAGPLTAAPRPRGGDDLPEGPRRLDDTPYRSRFGTEKEIALREHGGTAETERAVALGLRYLASRQRSDGSWGGSDDRDGKYRDVRVGKSALALLAFLGAGHTSSSATEHSAVVERAIRWLLASQDARTGHFGDSEAYGHGIATYALAECYALTRDERLRPAVEFAVRRILGQQYTRGGELRSGGWGYFYPDGATFDSWPRTSITSWQVMALESARLGGIEVPDAAFDRAREFLVRSWDEEMGRFRYNHSPERLGQAYRTLPGSTPAALFALSLLGEDLTSPRWSEAVAFVASCAPDGYRFEGEQEFVERAQGNLYFWYYGCLALLRHGGGAWERWNAALKSALPPAQDSDGSWEPIDVYCQYAGDDAGDRIYCTSMCVLALEVYYRYFTPLLRVDHR